jgi:uncharacterized membrane protein
MNMTDSVLIAAPIERVWGVYADVERWPTWTASVRSVELLDGPTLAVGGRARIDQPRFPRVVWTVAALDPGRSWTWVARSPGATTTATHTLQRRDDTTTLVTQAIDQRGPVGALVGLLTRRLTRRYLAMEAAGLRERAESRVAPT